MMDLFAALQLAPMGADGVRGARTTPRPTMARGGLRSPFVMIEHPIARSAEEK